MSAIFGIINKKRNTVDQNIIGKLKQTLQHRTTDGSNSWQQNNVFFWHAKLYVHPQQQNEMLPFEKDDLVIVADALLFNRDELFSFLSIKKEITFPDSQLILAAWQKWGKQCVHHLDGEYVFAIWNKQSKELFLVSDHIGFRPVFYYNSDDCFIFCSEIKGVEAAKQTPNYFNEEHIIENHFRQAPPNQTYNKEVFALCGGNTLTLSNNKINIEKYWIPKPLGKYHFTKPREWFDCLRDLLFKAVEKRLNPDVPVGITLSGGLDSSSIACILSQLLAKKNKPLYAFSSVLPIDYKGIEQDERKYIEIVNKHCPNIIQTYVEAPGVGPYDNIEQFFELDEEIPNGFHYMDRAILEAAKDKNIRSLFTGFGGDFWLSYKGRGVIYKLIKQNHIKQACQLLKQLRKAENKSLFYLLRTEYLANTIAYPYFKKIIKPGTLDWQQEQTTLKDEFVNKFTYLDFKPVTDNRTNMLELIKTGRWGKFPCIFNNRNEFYQIKSCDPIFDKDLNEFLAEVPLELFLYKGYKRSLIRHSMYGVLPKEINWRMDKLPYNPDYVQRFLDGNNILEETMQSYKGSFIFTHFINEELIEKHKNDNKSHKGFSSATTDTSIRIMQAGILLIALKYLTQKGYLFEIKD